MFESACLLGVSDSSSLKAQIGHAMSEFSYHVYRDLANSNPTESVCFSPLSYYLTANILAVISPHQTRNLIKESVYMPTTLGETDVVNYLSSELQHLSNNYRYIGINITHNFLKDNHESLTDKARSLLEDCLRSRIQSTSYRKSLLTSLFPLWRDTNIRRFETLIGSTTKLLFVSEAKLKVTIGRRLKLYNKNRHVVKRILRRDTHRMPFYNLNGYREETDYIQTSATLLRQSADFQLFQVPTHLRDYSILILLPSNDLLSMEMAVTLSSFQSLLKQKPRGPLVKLYIPTMRLSSYQINSAERLDLPKFKDWMKNDTDWSCLANSLRGSVALLNGCEFQLAAMSEIGNSEKKDDMNRSQVFVNRPFTFLLRNDPTNLIMIQGRFTSIAQIFS